MFKSIKPKLILTVAVPAVMAIFFLRNIYLSETQHMDSWMGGGMRMFAKIDKMMHRAVILEYQQNGKSQSINLKDLSHFAEEEESLRILPDEEVMNSILNRLNEKPELAAEIIGNTTTTKSASEIVFTRITVHAVQFDATQKIVSLKPLRHVTNR